MESADNSGDLQRYILQDKQPVVCENEATWRAFMNKGDNLLIAQDAAGRFQVVTVFLGFNYGSVEKPKFFQTTCLGVTSEKRPDYASTWEKAMVRHKGAIKCGEMLTAFEAEQAAGVDRSWEFIDCHVLPGELQFVLESEAEALRVMPEDKEHWKRRGCMIVFCFDMP
ncbi:MAG: hypothetical protein AAF821_25620 [Cyanobacteria bacterium P01_D01_bin.156]